MLEVSTSTTNLTSLAKQASKLFSNHYLVRRFPKLTQGERKQTRGMSFRDPQCNSYRTRRVYRTSKTILFQVLRETTRSEVGWIRAIRSSTRDTTRCSKRLESAPIRLATRARTSWFRGSLSCDNNFNCNNGGSEHTQTPSQLHGLQVDSGQGNSFSAFAICRILYQKIYSHS